MWNVLWDVRDVRFLVLCGFFAAFPSLAQVQWGGVRGQVTDPSGAPIPSAYVGVNSDSLPRGMSTRTDAHGTYAMPTLPVGSYTVTVAAPGFHTLLYHHLNVRLGVQLTFNARMSLGSVADSIEVNEQTSPMDLTSSQTATQIDASAFDALARGRSFHTVLLMAPGVRNEAKAGAGGVGGISVDGASGSENSYFIDGVEVTDVMSGALMSQNSIPFEFIRELQVKTGGFEAEFGGATGGVVNVTTRGGANAFHGDAQFEITASNWNAGDRGFYQRMVSDPTKAEYIRPREDSYRIFYPGGSFGGPLVRDRMFGYVSYMPEFERTGRTVDHMVDGRRVYGTDRVRHYALSRLDFSPISRLQLSGSWVWSPARRDGSLPIRDPRLRATAVDPAGFHEFAPSQTASLTTSYSVDGRTLVSARYGYKFLNWRTTNGSDPRSAYLLYRSPAVGVPGVPIDLVGGAGTQNFAGSMVTMRDVTTRHNLYLDVSRVASVAGQQHIFKAGYALNRLFNDPLDGYPTGRFDIFWGRGFSRGSLQDERGTYGYYVWEDGPRRATSALGRNHGLYVQDTWRATPRLTLNLGLRSEREFMPPYQRVANGREVANPIDFSWGDKLAPRLGAAWDISGTGEWKLSGSLGLFYDVMKYSLARTAFGGETWMSHVYRLEGTNLRALSLANPGALGTPITSINNRSIPVNERGQWHGIDPDLKPYASREFTASLERRLTSRFNLGIRYSRKELLRAIEDIGVLDGNDNEVYIIGNPGFGMTRDSSSAYGAKTPDAQEWLVPKAKRQYDAMEIRGEGTIRGYSLLASYTFSRLYGNYAGLANSDEAGRMDPSISRSFDLPTYYFDSTGRQRNTEGRLATDRPHVMKLFGWREYSNRLGATSVGLTQMAMSGGLDSTTIAYVTAPTFPFGRGDMGRMPVLTQTDMNLAHTFRLGERYGLKFEVNATNLLNQATVISRVTQMNWNGNITREQLPLTEFFAGYRVSDHVRPGKASYNPIYGLPGRDPVDGGASYHSPKSDLSSAFLVTNPGVGAYQGPRSFRFAVRLTF
ncbi:MAG TPA: TonB-dependent receptor [Bryobacteraceae bacterium]|nr:TonB-dependent receptor [Bryobacteraceae bacterium]